jgi:homoserine O-acetyltransferase/O-succinyltransferase
VLIGSPYGDDDTAHDFLIGPGQANDPAVDFVIATNQLGNGKSSSPSNTPAPQHGPDFPQVTIRDDVEASYRLVTQEFGIKKRKAVVGYSMGGQQALQWGVSHPDLMRAIVPICSTAREYPFGFARLEGAKGAITGDSSWDNGRYKQPPLGGIQAIGLHWVAWAYSPEGGDGASTRQRTAERYSSRLTIGGRTSSARTPTTYCCRLTSGNATTSDKRPPLGAASKTRCEA